MRIILRVILVGAICNLLSGKASAWQLGYFKARDIERTPITSVGWEKYGKPILGVDPPLEFRRLPLEEDRTRKRGVLAVRMNGTDGSPEERFLAYPLEADSSAGVHLVAEKGPACIWTSLRLEEKNVLGKRPGIGGSARPATVIRVRWEELFSVSDGPFKGQVLCGDEHKSLVLLDVPTLRKSPTKSRIGKVVEFTYDDDPNDGK